jgi:predicted nucleic acid binding AN1-type Zn finger protein
MECKKCHNKYCLDHRLYESHDCEIFKNEEKINELDILRNKISLQNSIIKDLKKLIK